MAGDCGIADSPALDPAEVLIQPGVVGGALADKWLASGRIAGVAAGVARPTLLLVAPGIVMPPW